MEVMHRAGAGRESRGLNVGEAQNKTEAGLVRSLHCLPPSWPFATIANATKVTTENKNFMKEKLTTAK